MTKCHRCEQDYLKNKVFCSLCGLLLHKPNIRVKVMETRSPLDGSKFEGKITQAHVNDIRGRRVVKTEAQKETAYIQERQRAKEVKAHNRIRAYVP